MYSSLPIPEPFQNRFTLVTTASFNLDERFTARRIICGLPPLTDLSANIFLILMSFAFLFHAEALRTPARASLRDSLSLGGYPRALPRFPATMASSDYCPRLRYWQFSQVPVQNFRGTPSPLPRCARRTQIESVRRCWLHAYRIADHADSKLTRLYVGGSLALRLTALSGRTPAHRSPSARSAILIVCRFLYDIAPSAISSAELLLGVPVSFIPDPLEVRPSGSFERHAQNFDSADS